MLLDYVIIKLPEVKIIKGAFTYYTITEEEGVYKLLIHDYGGWGGDKISYSEGHGGHPPPHPRIFFEPLPTKSMPRMGRISHLKMKLPHLKNNPPIET